jgi:hypothetical protein
MVKTLSELAETVLNSAPMASYRQNAFTAMAHRSSFPARGTEFFQKQRLQNKA